MTALKATATGHIRTLGACVLQLMRKCATAAPVKCSWRLQLI
jgi:hypothetical protein